MSRVLRVLLVEDDHEDAHLFQRRCPARFRVSHVTSSDIALSQIDSEPWDIAFIDYRLGGASGLDLVRAIRDRDPRLPVVLMTGQDVHAIGENALLAGATDFMSKDGVNPSELERVARWALIRRHVAHRQTMGEDERLAERLLGQSPRIDTSAVARLRRVLYLSRARESLRSIDLFTLCSRFAAANARTMVTGVLLMVGDRFLQVIEGEATTIEVLLRRIEQDPRHGDMAVLVDETTPQRGFADWNMGCLRIEERYDLAPAQWRAVCDRVLTLLNEAGCARSGLHQLIRTLPQILRSRELAVS